MKRQFAQRAPFSAILMISLIISLGLCCSLVRTTIVTPLNNSADTLDVAYSVTSSGLILIIVFSEIHIIRFIRRRSLYHQSQEIFWPFRCRHCAKAVGILKDETPANTDILDLEHNCTIDQENNVRTQPSILLVNQETHTAYNIETTSDSSPGKKLTHRHSMPISDDTGYPAPKSRRGESIGELESLRDQLYSKSHDQVTSGCVPQIRHEPQSPTPIQTPILDQAIATPNSPRRVSNRDCDCQALFTRPHRSLLRIFAILAIVGLTNALFLVTGDILCLFHSNASYNKKVSFVLHALLNITAVNLSLSGLLFFNTYYDAVFVKKGKFCFPIGFMLACCVWIIASKANNPFGPFLTGTTPDLHPARPCKLNGTFGEFIVICQKLTSPFIIECGIMAFSILWHIWNAFLPACALKLSPCLNKVPDCLFSEKSEPFWKPFLSKRKIGNKQNPREIEALIPPRNSRKQELEIYLRRLFILFLMVALLLFTSLVFLRAQRFFDIPQNMQVYIAWSCEIAYGIPLIGLLHFQSYLTDNKSHDFPLKRGVSVFRGLESCDRTLLLGCGGTFILNILRVMGAIIIFLRTSHSSRDELTLAYFMFAYGLFKVYKVWLMTLFLFINQRQLFEDYKSIKWTLVCIMYMCFFSTTVWILENTAINQWVGLRMFLGEERGWAIGIILEPLLSLYNIHASLVAYEAHREIYRDYNA